VQPFLTKVHHIWQWLVTPPSHGYIPPYPDDRNARGIGWAGDREEYRYRPFTKEN
jgi:hypothetical protein